MKKLASILALVMLFSLISACGQTVQEPTEATTQEVAQAIADRLVGLFAGRP